MIEPHPFYQAHRPAMDVVMDQRISLAEELLRASLDDASLAALRPQALAEFEAVLRQMPYIGGSANRMSDFFMRFLGFLALARVLRRLGLAPAAIVVVARDILMREMLAMPEAERLAAGRAFLSDTNRATLRGQAAFSREERHPGDFIYDVVEPSPGDDFLFGIDYRACGFCRFAAQHGDADILPVICGLDFVAYEARGIHLERTQTLAGGDPRCNFRFRATEG
jgi:hypothetical protein